MSSCYSHNEKKDAVAAWLRSKDLVTVSGPKKTQQQLIDTFAEILIRDDERGTEGEQLLGHARNLQSRFVLHPANTLQDSDDLAQFELDDQQITVHVALGAPDREELAEHISNALGRAARQQQDSVPDDPSMPLSASPQDVTGKDLIDGSFSEPDTSAPASLADMGLGTDRRRRRAAYDFRSSQLPEGRKHIELDLRRNARARMGQDESGEPSSGLRYLWEVDHAYLLSDDALQSKTPGRWFRDMCVLSGLSTGNLSDLIKNGYQETYSYIQNDKTNTPHRMIMPALEFVVESPITLGRGRFLPAGSLFGLPTLPVTDHEGIERVRADPTELDRISRLLLKQQYIPSWLGGHEREDFRHRLKRLEHLADAYRDNAINRREMAGAELHKYIRGLFPERFQLGKRKKKDAAAEPFLTGASANPEAAFASIREQNAAIQAVTEDELEGYFSAILRLPFGTSTTGTPLSPEEAFVFARGQNPETVCDFLRQFRVARGETVASLCSQLKIPESFLGRVERKLVTVHPFRMSCGLLVP